MRCVRRESMPAEPALLLFDLGGVLLENAVFERLRELLPGRQDPGALKERWLASTAVRRFELGEIDPDAFADAFLAEWDVGLSPAAFLAEFWSWPSAFYPQARPMLRALRQRYRVGCLSNSNVLHWQKFGGFEDDFDVALSSHRLGAIKPDEAAFVRALRACDVDAGEVCFFDDSMRNVDTARRLGIRAFHVEGVAPLLRVLRSEGLLRNEAPTDRSASAAMSVKVHPLTSARWPDLEALFEARGCSQARWCWCMYYRRSGARAPLPPGVTPAQANRAELKALVDAGRVPGLIGYRGDDAVGWVSLAPREEYEKLKRSPVMKAVDDRPVWSIVCFVVPAQHRGQGVARALLDGAIAYARKHGATLLEAYPVDKPVRCADDAMWFGSKSMYDRAGFEEVARRKPQRPIVRLKVV